MRIAVPGLPSAWSLRPRGRHALAVTRSAARGLIAPVAARAAAARAGTHTSHDATAWAVAGPVAARRERRRPDCSIGHITVHKAQNGGVAPGDDDENITKALLPTRSARTKMDTTIARLARIRSRGHATDGAYIHGSTLPLYSITIQYENESLTINCAMQIKCHFVCHHHRPHARHHGSRDAGPRRNIAPAAAASCVVQGQPHVRELDRAEISMRHAMRDDGIGSRQEQRSQTQLSHTLEGGLEGGGVPVTARSSAQV